MKGFRFQLDDENIVTSSHGLKPWQKTGLEDEFPLKLGYFQGQTVNLPEGRCVFFCIGFTTFLA